MPTVNIHAKDQHPPRAIIELDPYKSFLEQKGLHNRYHPDIPPVAHVQEGEVFRVHCLDWSGSQVGNNDSADDIRDMDLSYAHVLSGPIAIDSAEPGDCLFVDILDVQPFPDLQWGYTAVVNSKGGGFLCEDFDWKDHKAIWDFEGIYATSRHVPGVRFAGIPHPGILATAPSQELLETWNKREQALIDKEQSGRTAAVAVPPSAQGAFVGQDLAKEVMEKIAREGARTIPPREHGGNADIKSLTKGSRAYCASLDSYEMWLSAADPVFVKGANLSVGDLHFSQGDGEIAFCGAIEMAGILTLRLSVIKNGVERFGLRQPMFMPSPVTPQYSERLVFQGISVDAHGTGEQRFMDASLAMKQAALNAIDYLMKCGYSREQALILLSAAPIDSHIAAIVDVPNAMVTMSIPTGIFEQDIRPEKMERIPKEGQAASCSN